MGVSDAENLARLRDAVRFSLDAAAAHDLSFYHRNGEGGVARTRANVRAGWEFLATAADLGHAGAIRELATAAGERYVRARAGGAKTLEAFLSELEREDARRGRPWVGDGDDGDDARARRRAPAASVSASRPLSGRARCSHEVRALVDAASRPRGPDAAAAWTLASCHRDGARGLDVDPSEEWRWRDVAAAAGHPAALDAMETPLGCLFRAEGPDSPLFIHVATAGALERDGVTTFEDVGACFEPGYDGVGDGVVAKSFAAAVSWYRRGADYMDARSQLALGLRCAAEGEKGGEGSRAMRAEALFWFVKAAGRIEYTRPTSRDDALTLGRRLACREASDASVDAAYRAGVCYDRGLGTTVDVTRAAEMYRRACAGLHYDAMCALGVLLLMKTRDDDAESHREATRWLREVADATGNDQAEVHMGIAYATGKGVEKDVERARAWYARAESAYDDAAMALREAGDRAWKERVRAARFEGDAPT